MSAVHASRVSRLATSGARAARRKPRADAHERHGVRADPDRGRTGREGRHGARAIAGVVDADNVAGPYDVIVKAEPHPRRPRQARRVGDPEGRRHHPHLHLPHRQSLTTCVSRPVYGVLTPGWWTQRCRPARAARRAWRASASSMRPVEELRVRQAGHLPEARVHRDRREARDGVHLVDEERRRPAPRGTGRPAPSPRSGTLRTRATASVLRLRDLFVGRAARARGAAASSDSYLSA